MKNQSLEQTKGNNIGFQCPESDHIQDTIAFHKAECYDIDQFIPVMPTIPSLGSLYNALKSDDLPLVLSKEDALEMKGIEISNKRYWNPFAFLFSDSRLKHIRQLIKQCTRYSLTLTDSVQQADKMVGNIVQEAILVRKRSQKRIVTLKNWGRLALVSTILDVELAKIRAVDMHLELMGTRVRVLHNRISELAAVKHTLIIQENVTMREIEKEKLSGEKRRNSNESTVVSPVSPDFFLHPFEVMNKSREVRSAMNVLREAISTANEAEKLLQEIYIKKIELIPHDYRNAMLMRVLCATARSMELRMLVESNSSIPSYSIDDLSKKTGRKNRVNIENGAVKDNVGLMNELEDMAISRNHSIWESGNTRQDEFNQITVDSRTDHGNLFQQWIKHVNYIIMKTQTTSVSKGGCNVSKMRDSMNISHTKNKLQAEETNNTVMLDQSNDDSSTDFLLLTPSCILTFIQHFVRIVYEEYDVANEFLKPLQMHCEKSFFQYVNGKSIFQLYCTKELLDKDSQWSKQRLWLRWLTLESLGVSSSIIDAIRARKEANSLSMTKNNLEEPLLILQCTSDQCISKLIKTMEKNDQVCSTNNTTTNSYEHGNDNVEGELDTVVRAANRSNKCTKPNSILNENNFCTCIPPKEEMFESAINEFNKISNTYIPYEIITCLMYGIQLLQHEIQQLHHRKSIALDAEILFPILVYILIHCDLNDFNSRLDFVERFLCDQDLLKLGETAYYMCSVKAAVEWINEHSPELENDKILFEYEEIRSINYLNSISINNEIFDNKSKGFERVKNYLEKNILLNSLSFSKTVSLSRGHGIPVWSYTASSSSSLLESEIENAKVYVSRWIHKLKSNIHKKETISQLSF